MVRRLAEQDQVAFVFQPLGTPPNSVIHKYMNEKKVPQLFVATGATEWNDRDDKASDAMKKLRDARDDAKKALDKGERIRAS